MQGIGGGTYGWVEGCWRRGMPERMEGRMERDTDGEGYRTSRQAEMETQREV